MLWPLLDITTTLDPNLLVAYRFGSTFLSDSPPRGEGRPDLAVKLLERGIRANPDQWRLYQDLGNVYYFDAKDYAKSVRCFCGGKQESERTDLDESNGGEDRRRGRIAGDIVFPMATGIPDDR